MQTQLPFQHSWKKLSYSINECPNRSPNNIPENIMVNRENDPSSRWTSSLSGGSPCGLWIKLKSMSVAFAVKFAKCSKVNGCFMKAFKLYGGLEKDKMMLLLDAELRFDEEPEIFSLQFTLRTKNTIVFPVLYLKICPISAWGTNNQLPSIYYVELQGENDPNTIRQVHQNFTNYLEKESLRLCLAHLRTRHLSHTPVPEPPLITMFYEKCQAGEWEQVEMLLEGNVKGWGISGKWCFVGNDKSQNLWPCGRAAHLMALSDSTQKIYLLAGWNGRKNLADFWVYHIPEKRWQCISENTEMNGGPQARSCGKMILDDSNGRIYVLGGYSNPSVVTSKSDFYCWENNRWTKLSDDTSKDGGPHLVSDLEICIDSNSQHLYVFGGRFQSIYEGLYRYDIKTRTWTLLRSDSIQTKGMPLKPRTECCMLFHPIRHQIFILAGNRGKDPLRDFYVYDINSDTVMELSRDIALQGGPSPLNIVKAVLDHDRDEIYLISGTTRQSTLENPETLKNECWIYRINSVSWHFLHIPTPKPCAAYTLTYSQITKKIYMFGGKEGDHLPVDQRLSDLWEMEMVAIGNKEAIRKAKFLVRKHQYLEMCHSNASSSIEPLLYLRSKLSEIVNHDDVVESLQFRELFLSYMFYMDLNDDWVLNNRIKLLDELMQYFNEFNTSRSIIDMVLQYETNLK